AHAVFGRLPARTQPGSARLVRRAGPAAGSGEPANSQAGGGRIRPSAGPRLRLLLGVSRNAGIRGGRAGAAGAVRGLRLPHFERLGRAGEAAGGVRGGHPGGFHHAGGGRIGGRGWPGLRAGGPAGGFCGAGAGAVRESRDCRRHGGPRPRRSGGPLEHGGHHRQAGGWLPGDGEGKTVYFPFRSRLRRLTMSEPVRSNSLALEPLGRSYTDQTTWRDLASTRKIVPLPRPNELVVPTAANLFTVSAS